MNNGVWLLLGGAVLLYFVGVPGAVVSKLVFVENGMTIDATNPLQINILLSILVQNPTSGSITLNSLAGSFSINGSNAGNVSDFNPTVIPPNSQTPITLNLTVSDYSIAAIILAYINSGSTSIVVGLTATANINNAPFPVNLSFQPVP
jgi:LEA14-like dessication related protein